MPRGSRGTSANADRPFEEAVWNRARQIARHYRIILEREPGGFLARAIEMPNVIVHGTTPNRCEQKAREALCVAAATMVEQGKSPPSAARKRAAQVNIRLTTEEKLLLEETARQEGFKGLSDFIRHLALAHTWRRTA
jgi:predicted RNase H-like HicB family nuclease